MAGRIVVCPKCNERIEEKLRIEKSKFLIVEGRDDEEFFRTMLVRLQINDVQVAGVGGKEKIRPNLKALTGDPLFDKITSLGIVRDADEDAVLAFKSIQNALKNADLPCPVKPLRSAGKSPKVTVMILPPGASSGALEDLCLESVKDDPAMACVDDYFGCLDNKGIGRHDVDLKKAMVSVFLSSRDDPTASLGIAAQKGCWPFENKVFDAVETFLRSI